VECFAIDQVELDEDHPESSKFLLTPEDPERSVDPETQARLEALLEAAGIGKLSSGDGKHLPDHEVLRRLTSSVSCALDEAAAALTRMRSDNPRTPNEKRSLVEACTDGDVGTVRKLLTEGRSVHETTEEGESLLSLACSAGYYELAQVCFQIIVSLRSLSLFPWFRENQVISKKFVSCYHYIDLNLGNVYDILLETHRVEMHRVRVCV